MCGQDGAIPRALESKSFYNGAISYCLYNYENAGTMAKENGRDIVAPYDLTEKPSDPERISRTPSPDEDALERSPTPLVPPPPTIDGGPRAWLQVVGSFLVFGNLWGMTSHTGVSKPTTKATTFLPTPLPASPG